MKVGELWKLKSSAPQFNDDAMYHEYVKISNVMDNFVIFTNEHDETVLDYYSGMPREMFIKAYTRVYSESR
jgi:hypothetical protein